VISDILPPTKPECIENVAKGIGWSVPIDSGGSWMKNPIRPEDASEDDYIELSYEKDDFTELSIEDDKCEGFSDSVSDWLNE